LDNPNEWREVIAKLGLVLSTMDVLWDSIVLQIKNYELQNNSKMYKFPMLLNYVTCLNINLDKIGP
jgi:hypothetical protein